MTSVFASFDFVGPLHLNSWHYSQISAKHLLFRSICRLSEYYEKCCVRLSILLFI